jgi:peptidoglycan glycosyltransferase
MWSNPSYDPSPLAGHDIEAVTDYGELLAADPNKPDLARAYREIYPTGSSQKPVTATVALDTGVVESPTNPVFPTATSYTPPQAGEPIENFGGQPCGGDLTQSLVQSCNTTFAEIGVLLGEQFPPGMQRFGFYQQPPIDLFPNAAASTGPAPGSFQSNQPNFAFSGIGQGPVAATPLQMALVAGGIANGGVVMTPHVMDEITNADGERSGGFDQRPWLTATSAPTAAAVTTMMVQVVENGTGEAAKIPGVTVAGKTGTAQVGDAAETVHAWFIAFAPAEDPVVAVAVIVEGGGDAGNDATGGEVAAPIARQVIEAVLAGV